MSGSGHLRLGATLAAATLAGALALSGCGSQSGTGASSPAGSASAAASSGASNASTSGGVSRIGVTLANSGSGDSCSLDHSTAAAGPVTFTVTNTGSTAITEIELQSDQRILGEKENLAPGLKPVSFTVTLGGGQYQLYCPGGTQEMVPLTVTGQASAQPTGGPAALLQQGATQYAGYVNRNIASMVTGAQALQKNVDSGNLAAAQKTYAEARVYYERIETDVDGFVLPGFKATDNRGNLDYLIDMRQTNLDPKVGWHGFHAVERDLFGNKKITASTKKLAAELTANAVKLKTLSSRLTYKPEDLANGAAGLLEEVQSQKIKGTEEAFSHIDLVDFSANVEGAQQSFAFLLPGLSKLDPTKTKQINQRFAAVNAMLDHYRSSTSPGGYRLYTAALRTSDANRLSQTVQALQDPLSTLAEKVATAR